MLTQRSNVAAQQRRRHLQCSLADQQLAVIVERDPRRLGAVIAVKAGFDEAIEIPNSLSIDREGYLLRLQRVCVARHDQDHLQ